jgi:hypothetical protein
MNNNQPYKWRRPAERNIAIIIIVVYILFLGCSILNSMCNLGLFSENQSPQTLGALFGAIIFFTILFGHFLIGVVAVISSFFARKLKWLFAIVGLISIIYSVGYPYILFTGDYDLEHIDPNFGRNSLIGSWQDNFYNLTLYDDGNFMYRELHSSNDSALNSDFTGCWYYENERVFLQLPDLQNSKKLILLKYHGKYFLSYDLPDDLDDWNGYLGLIHIKDTVDYSHNIDYIPCAYKRRDSTPERPW